MKYLLLVALLFVNGCAIPQAKHKDIFEPVVVFDRTVVTSPLSTIYKDKIEECIGEIRWRLVIIENNQQEIKNYQEDIIYRREIIKHLKQELDKIKEGK